MYALFLIIVSIISILIMALLFASEMRYYLKTVGFMLELLCDIKNYR